MDGKTWSKGAAKASLPPVADVHGAMQRHVAAGRHTQVVDFEDHLEDITKYGRFYNNVTCMHCFGTIAAMFHSSTAHVPSPKFHIIPRQELVERGVAFMNLYLLSHTVFNPCNAHHYCTTPRRKRPYTIIACGVFNTQQREEERKTSMTSA